MKGSPGKREVRLAAVELALFVALVLSFIWIWAGTFRHSNRLVLALGLGLTITTHLLHREKLADLGLRLDNLVPALKEAALPLVPLVSLLLLLGAANGTLNAAALDPGRFIEVFAWGFLQQYLLQGFIHRRVAILIPASPWREVTVGLIFSAFHWPNPVLVLVTFLAGYVFAVLFRRQPNLVVLALCHAVGSTAVAFAFDPGILHKMRVGPGYLRWRSG